MAVCALAVRFRRTKDRHVSRSVGRGSVGLRRTKWSGPIFAFFCRVSSFCRTLQGFRLLCCTHCLPLSQFAFLPGCNDLSNRCLSYPYSGEPTRTTVAQIREFPLPPPSSSLPLPLLL